MKKTADVKKTEKRTFLIVIHAKSWELLFKFFICNQKIEP